MASVVSSNAYEQERLARIAENQARLEAIVGKVANDFKEHIQKSRAKPRRRASTARAPRRRGTQLPSRRSDRNEGKAAPVYNEDVLAKIDGPQPRGRSGDGGGARVREFCGPREEVYTQAHLDLLGSCTTEWVLKVDGFDAAGERIYDRVSGKTCHQCRQKTIGKRTHCRHCDSADGVFCGDCLFMRYGENVDEALADPDWKCFHCRDPVLCNGSICRTQRGWMPTGQLYRRAKDEGYRSVAHYIIQTCLEEQAAAGVVGGPAPALDSEPSGASAQTAHGDAVRGVAADSGDVKATAETVDIEAATNGARRVTGRRMRQETLDGVLLSQRKAGPPSGGKGSRKILSLKDACCKHQAGGMANTFTQGRGRALTRAAIQRLAAL